MFVKSFVTNTFFHQFGMMDDVNTMVHFRNTKKEACIRAVAQNPMP